MSLSYPTVEHIYQHHTLDSTRWDKYVARNEDVIIATPYKSGTTWMQMIVMHLIFQDLQIRPIWEISPWLDNRKKPVQEVIDLLDRQEHRRFIKTHLPLDGLPFHPQAKYIVVGRDGRDVFMSLWNHYSNLAEASYADKERQGFFFPRCPADIRDFWQEWITSGSFAWEHEGYPFWSNLRHVQTWWDFSHLPNILFVHFRDRPRDLEEEIIRIADYLDISVPDERVPGIVDAVTFANVKQNADARLLRPLAAQAGPAVHAVHLANDPQKSRERLVSAREEERRRLRRDLHDGLGPVLASQGLKLAAIKQVLDRDTAIAERLLDQVMLSNEHTIDDVRRLVYGLRPPALDDLGLVGAIRDQFTADGGAGAVGLHVTVDAPIEDLSSIAAAVEVAAYWIVQEAFNADRTQAIIRARSAGLGA